MKIRSGFVSNSSSSSFIVAFKKKPKTAEEMKKLLFGGDDRFTYRYFDTEESWTTQEIADIVFNDLNKEHWFPENDEGLSGKITGELAKSKIKAFVKYFCGETSEEMKDTEKLIKENPKAVFFLFSYSDNRGAQGCAMEHGGLFDTLPNVSIGHH